MPTYATKSPFAKGGFRGNVNICGTATILKAKHLPRLKVSACGMY